MAETTENTMNVDIKHPEVWSMTVRISDNALTYAIYSNVEDNSLYYGEFPFSGKPETRMKELEAVVYDNAFFLNNYDHVDFLIESSHFIIVPNEFSANGDAQECEKYYRFIYGDDNMNVATEDLPSDGAAIVFGIHPELEAFLRRTFYNPPMHYFLTPMLKFFRKKGAFGSADKMFAFFNDDKVEVFVMKNSKITFANYYKITNVDDAFYYVMNAWKQNDMNPQFDELHIFGDKQMRKDILPKLRVYVDTVIQTIFPAPLLRLGKKAMSAPFDLIILPTCE